MDKIDEVKIVEAKRLQQIIELVNASFSTFGGGKASPGNPLAEALKDKLPQFALGVDVTDVVCMVVAAYKHPHLDLCIENLHKLQEEGQ